MSNLLDETIRHLLNQQLHLAQLCEIEPSNPEHLKALQETKAQLAHTKGLLEQISSGNNKE